MVSVKQRTDMSTPVKLPGTIDLVRMSAWLNQRLGAEGVAWNMTSLEFCYSGAGALLINPPTWVNLELHLDHADPALLSEFLLVWS